MEEKQKTVQLLEERARSGERERERERDHIEREREDKKNLGSWVSWLVLHSSRNEPLL